MDLVQDAFTQRLLQRASLRRSRDSNGTTNKQALQRRNNIIKAIKEPHVPSATNISYDGNNNVSLCIVEPEFSETLVLSDDSELPIMESTRKHPHSDSTKTLYSSSSNVASTISTIAMFVKTASRKQIHGDSEEMRGEDLNDTAAYNENDFLEDALGDELNNTSVTYDGSSAWNKSDSDFGASDLMSVNEFPIEKSVEETFAMQISGMQPRSSSTLNRSMKLNASVLEEMAEPNSGSNSRLRAFFRLLRRLLQNFKKVMSLRASSER